MIDSFVMLGSILDLTLTYNYLKLYKAKFPHKDFIVIESNPLIRSLVRSKGLKEGMITSSIIILFILMAILYVSSTPWKYFLAGVYYMMVTFHLTNFLAIKRMKGGKQNGKKKED